MTRQRTTQQTTQPEHGVTRTYRVASKIGEDFHTVEMTVTLPVGATDAEIAEAIDLGTRIYQAQSTAMLAEIGALRAALPSTPPPQPAPPTRPQLDKVGQLQARVSIATIAAVYRELHIPGVSPQTKAQASALLDRLKAIINGIAPDPAADRNAADAAQEPAAQDDPADLPF
jgi:hypothetical protein